MLRVGLNSVVLPFTWGKLPAWVVCGTIIDPLYRLVYVVEQIKCIWGKLTAETTFHVGDLSFIAVSNLYADYQNRIVGPSIVIPD